MKHKKPYLFFLPALLLLFAGCGLTVDLPPLEPPIEYETPVILDEPSELYDEPDFVIDLPEEDVAEETEEIAEEYPTEIIPDVEPETHEIKEEAMPSEETPSAERDEPIQPVSDKTEEAPPEAEPPEEHADSPPVIDENGAYTTKEDVALYLHTYGHLPHNFISKKDAEADGWVGGAQWKGKCIGGTYFGNYEGILPKKKKRVYYECDIGTMNKKSRGAKRIVYSNDGLIYYTEDHYETFELLYGTP